MEYKVWQLRTRRSVHVHSRIHMRVGFAHSLEYLGMGGNGGYIHKRTLCKDYDMTMTG